jgi:hypothetical protein
VGRYTWKPRLGSALPPSPLPFDTSPWCFLGNSYDEERCVVAGYDNGDVKLFDLRAMKLRWETTLPNGVRRTRDVAVQYFSFKKTLSTTHTPPLPHTPARLGVLAAV